MRLCLVLGCSGVDELWRVLTWREWIEWQDFYELEPWGELRADLRQVALAVTLLGAFAGSCNLPEPTYPYFGRDDFDADVTHAALCECRDTIVSQAARRTAAVFVWPNDRTTTDQVTPAPLAVADPTAVPGGEA